MGYTFEWPVPNIQSKDLRHNVLGPSGDPIDMPGRDSRWHVVQSGAILIQVAK